MLGDQYQCETAGEKRHCDTKQCERPSCMLPSAEFARGGKFLVFQCREYLIREESGADSPVVEPHRRQFQTDRLARERDAFRYLRRPRVLPAESIPVRRIWRP